MTKHSARKIDNFYLIVLFLILIIGAVLRIYRIMEWMPWAEDAGRDMTVARRMIIDRGPYNILVTSGDSSGFVINSPIYFLVTAGLYSITDSPVGVVIIYALWNILGIVFSYYIGKISGNRQLGLLCALFVACSYILVVFSRSIWQPTIVPTLTIFSILLVQLTMKKENFLWVIALINVSFFGIHFYYGYYPILLVNTFWVFIATKRLFKKHILLSLLCIVNYFVHACMWLLIVNPNNKMDHMAWLSWIVNKYTINHYFSQTISIINMVTMHSFFYQNYVISLIVVVSTILGLLYLVYKEREIYSLTTIIAIYISTIFFLGFYPDSINEPRLSVYFPLVLIGVSLLTLHPTRLKKLNF